MIDQKTLIIRNETEADHRIVETITRDAFWNLNVPGCNEHYLAHIMRSHPDFISELDFVAELDGQVIGNVMYTKARLVDEAGAEQQILTFGPVSIHPEYQRRRYSGRLLEHSFQKAAELGYDVIVIFGNPDNYVSRGFVSCRRHNICLEGGSFPSAMLVKELHSGTLDGRTWYYHESPVYDIDDAAAEEFDKQFEPREKSWQPSQEAFYIHSHSIMLHS